jgi:hypothetical protein
MRQCVSTSFLGRIHGHQTYVGGTVDVETVAGRHENQTEGGKDGHEQETFGTTPGIHHPSDGEVSGRGEGIGKSGGHTRQGVLLKRTRDIAAQAAIDGGLEGVDKVQEPDAVWMRCLVTGSGYRGTLPVGPRIENSSRIGLT